MPVFLSLLRKSPAILIVAFIWFLSSLSHPPSPDLGFEWADKLFHALAFGSLAAAFCLWFPLEAWVEKPFCSFLLVFIITVIVGIIDEVHQYYVPYRVASFGDVIADAVGAFFGAGFMFFILRFIYRHKRRT